MLVDREGVVGGYSIRHVIIGTGREWLQSFKGLPPTLVFNLIGFPLACVVITLPSGVEMEIMGVVSCFPPEGSFRCSHLRL